ncbi:MAG: DUF1173 family protein [Methylococcaceae bacterium]
MRAILQIETTRYTKDYLLATENGQTLLSFVKSKKDRPRCLCSDHKPEMYIARRGGLYYLARMPGTGDHHAKTCESHLLPTGSNHFIEKEISAQHLLDRLVKVIPACNNWVACRLALTEASSEIMVDGCALSSNLLVPSYFNAKTAGLDAEKYDAFFEAEKPERLWVIGYLKSLIERKYSYQAALKHMPYTKFWVKKDVVEQIPAVVGDEDSKVLCLFSCRKIPSGIEVDEAAGVIMEFAEPSVFAKPTEVILEEIRRKAGLPALCSEDHVFGWLAQKYIDTGFSVDAKTVSTDKDHVLV